MGSKSCADSVKIIMTRFMTIIHYWKGVAKVMLNYLSRVKSWSKVQDLLKEKGVQPNSQLNSKKLSRVREKKESRG